MITAISSHKRLIPCVGMPLFTSHAYTIVGERQENEAEYGQDQTAVECALQVGGENPTSTRARRGETGG